MKRRVIGRNVGTPGAIALFEPQRFDGPIARRRHAASSHQRVEDLANGVDRNMQLPAKFANIGDAQGANAVRSDGNLARLAKRESCWTDIGVCNPLENSARGRPHQGERAPVFGHVFQPRIQPRFNVIGDPCEVVGAEAGSGDDVETLVRQPRHRQIAFDAATGVEHLRIGELAHRRHAVGHDPVQRARRIAA